MIKTARLFAFGAVAGAAALMSAAPAAKAQTTTFAQYVQNNPSQQAFTLTNSGANSAGNSIITSTATQVLFIYSGGSANAFLNFNASNPLAATSSVSGGVTTLLQTFNNYSFSITSASNGTGTNYLSGSGNALVLSGSQGGGSSTLNVSTPPGSNVTFTSSVIANVNAASDRNFSIGLSSVNPVLAIAPNGYIRGFSAASSGTFANAAVPEPGMVTFALTSGAGLAGMVLRGRRRFKKAA